MGMRDASAYQGGLADAGAPRRELHDPTGRRGFATLLAALPGTWLLLFLVIPVLILIAWSFQPPGIGLALHRTFTGETYGLNLGTSVYWRIIGKTAFTALAVAAISVALAYPIAYVLAFVVSIRRRYVLLGLALLPYLTGYLLRIFAWRLLLGREGILNRSLEAMGLVDNPVEFFLFTRVAVILVLVYVWVPWAALPIFVRLEQLEPSLREAAFDLGAKPARVFRRVVLPLSLPGVYAAFFYVFIPTLGDFATASAVGGTGGTMVGNIIQGLLRVLSYPSGAVLGVVLLALALVSMAIGARLVRLRSWTLG